MQKPSQNYLNDSADNLPLKMQQQIDAVYLSNLNTIDFVNPKLLVVFSGGNAVGKMTTSNCFILYVPTLRVRKGEPLHKFL
jgi:hypothetical protein